MAKVVGVQVDYDAVVNLDIELDDGVSLERITMDVDEWTDLYTAVMTQLDYVLSGGI